LEFVRLLRGGGVCFSELCRRFGINRDTGYRVLGRYDGLGEAGLADGSRRPHRSPLRCSDAVEDAVVRLRDAHPSWGGRKLARRLSDLGVDDVPAASTITAILRRHGRLDAAVGPRHRPLQRFERAAPNELWQMDFKGHFALERGRCHPLTVLDDHCRYALALRACGDEQDTTVRGHLVALFRRYGLPEAILADNGPPWGSAGSVRSRQTALGVWLLQLGVRLCHGRPGHPQTQGKEERFHRTLDVELLQHNRFADLAVCQAAFDRWRRVYNEERPHEALGLAVPASRYQASPRAFPERLPEPIYDEGDLLRRVRHDGYISFQGATYWLSQAYAGHLVALRPTSIDGIWNLFFSRFNIAQVNTQDKSRAKQSVRYLSEQVSDLSPV
jgi:transposase InsO family protein